MMIKELCNIIIKMVWASTAGCNFNIHSDKKMSILPAPSTNIAVALPKGVTAPHPVTLWWGLGFHTLIIEQEDMSCKARFYPHWRDKVLWRNQEDCPVWWRESPKHIHHPAYCAPHWYYAALKGSKDVWLLKLPHHPHRNTLSYVPWYLTSARRRKILFRASRL